MTWLAVLAVPALGGPVEPAPGVLLAPVDDPVAFCQTVTAAAEAAGAGHALVAAPPALGEATRCAVTLTSAHRPALRTGLLVAPHAPLFLHAALVAAAAYTRQPGVAHAYALQFARASWSGMLTPSVARLPTPDPGPGQYLRSLLPGASFLVSFGPHPGIGSAGSLRHALPEEVTAQRLTLLVSQTLPARTSERLATAAGAQSVRPYALPGDWSAVTGHRRAVQLSLVAADPFALRVPVAGRCGQCDEPVAGPVCPFCSTGTAAVRSRRGERVPFPTLPGATQ